MSTITKRVLVGTALTGIAAITLAGCSSDSNSANSDDKKASTERVDTGGAADEGGEITVWAWEPSLTPVVEAFEEAHPDVKVDLVNVGTGIDSYTALQNAITAGQGLPDVAQVEYYALPQFALQDSLTDLTTYGAADLDGKYAPGPWDSVHSGEQVIGLPMDSGPMALFYNKALFDEFGIDVPTTWEEFAEAGRKFQEQDPNVFIANDSGDAGFATSMMWQTGGKPWSVDGTTVDMNLDSDEGVTQFTELWQGMLDEGTLSPINGWSDEWFQGMANGTIATLPIGAWMPANLKGNVPDGAGDWRVAPLPRWDTDVAANSENGGSSLAIPSAAENKELAYEFIKFANEGDGVQIRLDNGAFPATTADLNSDEFLNEVDPYFGDQKINEVLSQASADVVPGWQYLPFQVYANTVFGDSAGQAYLGKSSLADGLVNWQDTLTKYGNDQGFTVN